MPVWKPSPGVLNRLRSVFNLREAPNRGSLVVPEQQRLVAPEQLAGKDEQLFRALTESGYSLAEALDAIRQEGLQAEMSRRDLFRLGRDAAQAGSMASNFGGLANLIPEVMTSSYPEVSRERILRTVRPLLARATPLLETKPGPADVGWENDFNIWSMGNEETGDLTYDDPRFEDKMTSYLAQRLKSPAETEEATSLLQDIPAWQDNLTYYAEDGRPKELWRSWLEGEETMPNFSDPMVTLPGVVTPEDLYSLSETYDPEFGHLVDRMDELAEDAAEQYIPDYEDLLRFQHYTDDDISLARAEDPDLFGPDTVDPKKAVSEFRDSLGEFKSRVDDPYFMLNYRISKELLDLGLSYLDMGYNDKSHPELFSVIRAAEKETSNVINRWGEVTDSKTASPGEVRQTLIDKLDELDKFIGTGVEE